MGNGEGMRGPVLVPGNVAAAVQRQAAESQRQAQVAAMDRQMGYDARKTALQFSMALGPTMQLMQVDAETLRCQTSDDPVPRSAGVIVSDAEKFLAFLMPAAAAAASDGGGE